MRHLRIVGTSASVILAAVVAVGVTVPAAAVGKVALSPYTPFPQKTLTILGDSFVRPTLSQVASVRVPVLQAYAVGLTQTGTVSKGAKVTVRLGLFSDKWTHPSAVKVLAYAVIFDGVVVPSYGPNGGPGGHELVVIVNAHSGSVIQSFSYR